MSTQQQNGSCSEHLMSPPSRHYHTHHMGNGATPGDLPPPLSHHHHPHSAHASVQANCDSTDMSGGVGGATPPATNGSLQSTNARKLSNARLD